jgi:hypothetical protein
LAIEKIDALLATFEEFRAAWLKESLGSPLSFVNMLSDTPFERLNAEIKGQLPLVIDIAHRVTVDLGKQLQAARWGSVGFPYQYHVGLLHELKAAIISLRDASTILGTAGAFEALVDGVPADMRDTVAKPLADYRFTDAVRAAATYVFDVQLPGKTGIPRGVSAATDIGNAFSSGNPKPGEPRLRRPGVAPGSANWKSAHEGAAQLV